MNQVDGQGRCEQHGTTWDVVQGTVGCPECGNEIKPAMSDLKLPLNTSVLYGDRSNSIQVHNGNGDHVLSFEIGQGQEKHYLPIFVLFVDAVNGREALERNLKVAEDARKDCAEVKRLLKAMDEDDPGALCTCAGETGADNDWCGCWIHEAREAIHRATQALDTIRGK